MNGGEKRADIPDSSGATPNIELPTGSFGPLASKILEMEPADPAPQPLSKNALKKAAKAERFAAKKLERRAREKEAKREKKRRRAEKRAGGELEADDDDNDQRKKRPRLQFGGRVIVDLGFDDLMSDKEITSLSSQLAYTYSVNRHASFPFSLVFTSLNGRTLTRLESVGDGSYKRWTNTEWRPESFEGLWFERDAALVTKDPSNKNIQEPDAGEGVTADRIIHEPRDNQQCVKSGVVYLTADSEEELRELKPDETYIIGGICDHNRYKDLCLNRAKQSGIRTARLPIGRYLASLPTRKVLTVNQVFEILVKWVETKDWQEALYSVIPKRKFQSGGKGGHDSTADDRHIDGDGDDAEQDPNQEDDFSPDPVVVREME